MNNSSLEIFTIKDLMKNSNFSVNSNSAKKSKLNFEKSQNSIYSQKPPLKLNISNFSAKKEKSQFGETIFLEIKKWEEILDTNEEIKDKLEKGLEEIDFKISSLENYFESATNLIKKFENSNTELNFLMKGCIFSKVSYKNPKKINTRLFFYNPNLLAFCWKDLKAKFPTNKQYILLENIIKIETNVKFNNLAFIIKTKERDLTLIASNSSIKKICVNGILNILKEFNEKDDELLEILDNKENKFSSNYNDQIKNIKKDINQTKQLFLNGTFRLRNNFFQITNILVNEEKKKKNNIFKQKIEELEKEISLLESKNYNREKELSDQFIKNKKLLMQIKELYEEKSKNKEILTDFLKEIYFFYKKNPEQIDYINNFDEIVNEMKKLFCNFKNSEKYNGKNNCIDENISIITELKNFKIENELIKNQYEIEKNNVKSLQNKFFEIKKQLERKKITINEKLKEIIEKQNFLIMNDENDIGQRFLNYEESIENKLKNNEEKINILIKTNEKLLKKNEFLSIKNEDLQKKIINFEVQLTKFQIYSSNNIKTEKDLTNSIYNSRDLADTIKMKNMNEQKLIERCELLLANYSSLKNKYQLIKENLNYIVENNFYLLGYFCQVFNENNEDQKENINNSNISGKDNIDNYLKDNIDNYLKKALENFRIFSKKKIENEKYIEIVKFIEKNANILISFQKNKLIKVKGADIFKKIINQNANNKLEFKISESKIKTTLSNYFKNIESEETNFAIEKEIESSVFSLESNVILFEND